MSRVLCYITSEEYKKKFYCDEVPLVEELKKRGVKVRKCVWNDPKCDLSGSSLAVIRTAWDYHLDSAKFIEWLKEASKKITILNDAEAVIRNSNKGYLRALQEHGVPIVPTEFLEKGSSAQTILDAITKRGWGEVVFKPAVGASAYGLCKLHKNESEGTLAGKDEKGEDVNECIELMKTTEGLLQPFQSSVCTKGELSLVFFNNKYSHATVKIPSSGNFTVQGGTKTSYTASPACIDIASRALEAFSDSKKFLYARIEQEDEFLVTEVELIEPELFFLSGPPSATIAFADAICELLDASPTNNVPTSPTSPDTTLSPNSSQKRELRSKSAGQERSKKLKMP